MSAKPTPHRLLGLLWWRRPDGPNEPADYGTAFGLELTLMPEGEEPRTPSAPAPAARNWLRRITRPRTS